MAKEITVPLLRTFLPKRPVDAHKGTFGHLFVIAGSRGFTGAAKLACEGAGRSGVGLVTAGVPRPLGDFVALAKGALRPSATLIGRIGTGVPAAIPRDRKSVV